MAKKKVAKKGRSSPRVKRRPPQRQKYASPPLPTISIESTPQELRDLTRLAVNFRDQRDWKQFHNPKDMALSMALEVSEVIELMQWKNGDALRQHLQARREDLGDELSDVLYWVLTIAHDFGIDIAEAFRSKLIKSAAKYPIEKSRGRSSKYTEL